MMCEGLAAPKSIYYQSLHHVDVESNRDRENSEIIKRIICIHKDSKWRYGVPKSHIASPVESKLLPSLKS